MYSRKRSKGTHLSAHLESSSDGKVAIHAIHVDSSKLLEGGNVGCGWKAGVNAHLKIKRSMYALHIQVRCTILAGTMH